ncbi:uncharacterized protein CCR75_005994 [Bremia lactucae]|uniref:General transcription factor 3C polypeptide 5 n=1 Tax=Bremia lactucae TaxID=4779 RepID=A0A976FQZ0_BRELC|nr:hypothetical protein CCR75_005994 [Bremia lactucae]
MGDSHFVAEENAIPIEAKSASSSVQNDGTQPQTVCHVLQLHGDGVRPLVGLELPVYGSNMTKILGTVNGLSTLQHAHETKSQFLPVKLRPTEPSCKPLFADLTKTQIIVLRLKRSRKKEKPTALSKQVATNETTDQYQITAEVAGLVTEKYVCEGMADFQYFTARSFYPSNMDTNALNTVSDPMEAANPVKTNAIAIHSHPLSTPSPQQQQLQRCLRPYLVVNNETQLEMIPEVFSKVDLPLKYEFRQKSGYRPTTIAKKSSSTMTYLNFQDDSSVPTAPKPETPVLRRRSVGIDDNGVDARVLQVLQRKLALKPVWLRSKLFQDLDAVECRAARRLLRQICYVFVDGPWRGSWIKMGYDPRSIDTVESASQYQVVELRNIRELVHSKVTLVNRKRVKKYVSSSVNHGEKVHVKGPRIVKVTQTSAHDNAQAAKRRRKERFSRGITRRSCLVEPEKPSAFVSMPLPPTHLESLTLHSENECASEDEQEGNDSEGVGDTGLETHGHKGYEIFGIRLANPNVLFQLSEIDDLEVREWMAQFSIQSSPSLLGGWFPTQMFLPLREIIRLRIAALVGRSNAELETRRKRLDVIKKQALSDYAEELAGRTLSTKAKKDRTGSKKKVNVDGEIDSASVAPEEDDFALERALVLKSAKEDTLLKEVEIENDDEEDEEDDEDLDEVEDLDSSAGVSGNTEALKRNEDA